MMDIPVYSDDDQDHYKVDDIGIINYKNVGNIILSSLASESDFDLGDYENARMVAMAILPHTPGSEPSRNTCRMATMPDGTVQI